MTIKRICSGCNAIDKLLDGGLETDTLTVIYGPNGVGKTLISMIMCIDTIRKGKKVIYVDTEGGFSTERLKQIAPDYKEILSKMLFLKPINFEEQKKAFHKLKSLIDEKVGLVVIDSIAMLYRYELGQNKDVYNVNRELGLQLAYLNEIARKKNIPVVVTNQVYSTMDNTDNVAMVGGDILKYTAKCQIELKKFKNGKRVGILRRHRSIPEEKHIMFDIIGDGIKETEEIKEENKEI